MFVTNPITDLNNLIETARAKGVSRVLILAGKPLLWRVGTELSPPVSPQPIHFRQTEALALAILSAEQTAELDKEGAVEIDYESPNQAVRINIFFGDGSHNFVVFL